MHSFCRATIGLALVGIAAGMLAGCSPNSGNIPMATEPPKVDVPPPPPVPPPSTAKPVRPPGGS